LLSRALVELGHSVEVWSGQPYPELLGGVELHKIPSLDLWGDPDAPRREALKSVKNSIDLAEWASTVTGGFKEPITFCRRVARRIQPNGKPFAYDIIHDNQSLGAALLPLRTHAPLVATIHHPVTRDRRLALDASRGLKQWWGHFRFYNFLPEQIRVARQMERIMTVSECSLGDISDEYRIPRDRMRVVGNGIHVDVFQPIPGARRESDRLITTLSADQPLKGFRYLAEALAILRRERPELKLTVIGEPGQRTGTAEKIRELGLEGAIEFTGRVADHEIAERYSRATLAVVPSLYEGFGFPAGEAMACEVPLVSTRGGALPEVVGTDGSCGILAEAGDAPDLARAIAEVLAMDEDRRRAMGESGRRRVLANFTWQRAAERTVEVYYEALALQQEKAAC
jgi:glycosyltransferase involved in cell wall biosynthesis